VLSNSVKTGT
jgi:hypothetical protein